MSLRFHWRLPVGGETSLPTRASLAGRVEPGLPDLEAQAHFCRAAEESGIDSLLTDFGHNKPDSILLAAALGLATRSIKLIVAYRSGLIAPASFVQQINTLSALIGGRFSLNIVAGHTPEEQRSYGDFLPHDERYQRTDEFLTICRAFWRRDGAVDFHGRYYSIENGRLTTPFLSSERSAPEILVAGASPAALALARKHGSCWMRLGDAPERLRTEVAAMRAHGVEVGVRLSVIARPTHDEAVRAAQAILSDPEIQGRGVEGERAFVAGSDSVGIKATYELGEREWLTPYLWTGAVRAFGAPTLAIVGSADEVAAAVMEYRDIGVSQFILSGWPKLDEMLFFGREVLPRIRRREREAGA